MRLKKGLLFSDIHFGRKQNSDEHNQICLNFIDFLCLGAKKHNADHIMFLGDWFEIRNSINVSTLNYGYQGAKKLNDLGIPIYFIVGNHDMYTKHSRYPYSTIDYNAFENFVMIDTPTIEDIGTGALLCPYLFHEEYPEIVKYKVENVYGHFEFQGFVVTGTNVVYTNGPDHHEYKQFKNIFSGHFHKRQQANNVTYIGSPFCMDYSDANDHHRGYCIHDHANDNISFVDWPDSPQYITANLSDIVNGSIEIPDGANIRCIADINLEYSKLMEIKNSLVDLYSLKTIQINEPNIQYSVDESIEEQQFISIDESIVAMLNNIESPEIDNKQLVKIYKGLK